MAGETVKSRAICLDIRPWSRTSHVVAWLTPSGPVTTVVKGAERPKSAFLGSYDLNYTCDILYYARTKGGVHALRECSPERLRETLRGDYRALAVAGHCRSLVAAFAPTGPECAKWFDLLTDALDALAGPRAGAAIRPTPADLLARLLDFELKTLAFAGLAPNFAGFDPNAEWSPFSIENGSYSEVGPHLIRVSRPAAEALAAGFAREKNMQILLDAARVIGVFYTFHLDCAPDVRRSVLKLICNK